MKKVFVLLCILTMVLSVNAQDFAAWNAIKFTTAEDYKKHEGAILDVTRYILSTPRKAEDENQKTAFRTLITWMSGTPDYSFAVDKPITELMKNNDEVLSIYMAAMARYALENKDQAKDLKAVKLNSFTTLLNYCEVEANGIKQTKALKKAITAKNDGKLEQYLEL